MRFHRSVWLLLAVIAAGLGVFGWWVKGDSKTKETAPSQPGHPVAVAAKPSPMTDPLPAAFASLPATADSLKSLQDLKAKLASMTAAESVAWISNFLKSGKDKSTGLPFELASDHSMKQWPTFRTFLLDVLQKIDPAAADRLGREILSTPTTADEWALALRNVGLNDQSAQANDLLRSKTEALIANPAWQADPSVGYLNSFDVLVHTGATDSTPLLSGLLQRKDRKDLGYAAFLTLDRLVQKEPADVLSRIASDNGLQKSWPEMAAQQFARADLRDPDQQAIVKKWMLDPARTGTELNSFAGVYPNNNHFISNNLLTTEATQSGGDLAAHDRAALEILHAWAADTAFAPVKDHLATMIARLDGFVKTSGN